jgi:CDP-diacylglycerol--glycerol-3-phosphate 3-phosphatidyltransferase
MNLYASKARLAGALAPVVGGLARRSVAPDTISIAALPVAALAATCLLVSPSIPVALLAIPILATVRLVLNLLDGALARATGQIHPRGELLNEVGDRAADIAFLAPVAWLPGASAPVVLVGVLGAVLASYVGVVSKVAGGRRLYGGVLSKPGRMVLVSVAAVAAFVSGPGAWGPFGVVLCAGVALTLLERLVTATRELS